MTNFIIIFTMGLFFITILILRYFDYQAEKVRQIERQDMLDRLMARDFTEYQEKNKPENPKEEKEKKEIPSLSNVGRV